MAENKTDDNEEFVSETTDQSPDDIDIEVVESNQSTKIKSLQSKLKACEAEKATHLENLQRAKAEFLNAKRRLETERTAQKVRSENDCVERLLPLYDSFAMAMKNQEAWEAIDENWRKGVESIYTQLQSLLKFYSVTPTGKIGEVFNPERHEAMGSEPVQNDDAIDTVVSVVQEGFVRTVGDETILIRPARVIVGSK